MLFAEWQMVLTVSSSCGLKVEEMDSHLVHFSFIYIEINVRHMRCQRRILHISWHDFVSNGEVLHRTGLLRLEVSFIVWKRRLGLFGHFAWLSHTVPANQILKICTKARDGERPSQEWRRACGQPPTSWIHQNCRGNGRRLRLNSMRHDDDDETLMAAVRASSQVIWHHMGWHICSSESDLQRE